MNASARAPGIVLTSLPTLVVTLFLMIGAPSLIRAQTEIPRPEIPAGLRVKLLLLDGSTVKGRTGQPISTGVQLMMGNRLDLQVKEWDRVEIDTAWRRVGAHGGMGALIGGAVGVVVGIAISHNECSQLARPVDNCATTHPLAVMTNVLFGLTGIAVGGLVGLLVPNWSPFPL